MLAVAPSPVAAQRFYGGSKAHSALKIPIPVTSDCTSYIGLIFQLGHDFRTTQLIVWDKAVMSIATTWKQRITQFGTCVDLLDHLEEFLKYASETFDKFLSSYGQQTGHR